jgi:phosphoribosylformylglycinamidine cyclo-ligase
VFGLLAEHGNVSAAEMERVFNMGVGMVAIVAGPDSDNALQLLAERNVPSWVIGQVAQGAGCARLIGRHPA